MSNNFKKMIKKVTGSFEEKREWNCYKKRVNELPKDFKNAMDGIHTYMFRIAGGKAVTEVLYSTLDMFEEGVADGKKVSDIIGNDLGAFCDDIIKAIPDASWMEEYKKKTRDKINKKIK